MGTGRLELLNIVFEKLKENLVYRKILILLNKDPLEALQAIRDHHQDKEMLPGYDELLGGTERSIAISNLLIRLTDHIKNNNDAISNLIDVDLQVVKDSFKDRFTLTGINTIAAKLDLLYTTLEQPEAMELYSKMDVMNNINIKTSAEWFKTNLENVRHILDFDIAGFIDETNLILDNYIDHSLEMVEKGIELEVEFTGESDVIFGLLPVKQNTINPIENIKYLVEISLELETRYGIAITSLKDSFVKFKPNKVPLGRVFKLIDSTLSDYNENKITVDSFNLLSENYGNIVRTYFNLFSTRLNILSNYVDSIDEVTTQLNKPVRDIDYLQSNFK